MNPADAERTSPLGADRTALALLALLLVSTLEPIVLRGHVAVPHDNALELSSDRASDAPENRRFSDVNRYFVPALRHHFHGDHAAWLATWNPHVQLGKPASQHVGGYTKAYPLTYLLSLFSHDPYRLHAWLSVCLVTLLTFFSYLLFRALNLHPAASLAGAVGIGLNTRAAVIFGYAEFLATMAWSVGLMWLCLEFVQRRRLATWLAVVFVVYCLLTGSRQQAAIGASYFVVPFLLLSLFRHRDTWSARTETGLLLLAGAAVAAVLALPLLHDLIQSGLDSTRMARDPTSLLIRPNEGLGASHFFTEQLPLLWNPWVLANPGGELSTGGLNLTPFGFALLVTALVTTAARRAWPFAVAAAFFLSMELFPEVYRFAIRHLGFGFARWNPIAALQVPVFVLVAYAASSLLEDPGRKRIKTTVPLLAILACTGAAILPIATATPLPDLDERSVLYSALLALAAMAFVVWRSAIVVYLAAAVSVFAFTRPALLHRPLQDVVHTSGLVEEVRAATADGSRYAKFGRVGVLPSNMEVLVGLRSIHSYDSISSRRYDALARELSEGGTRLLGRVFDTLDSEEKLRSSQLRLAGVGALLSARELELPGWSGRRIGPRLWLYSADERPSLATRVVDYAVTPGAGVRLEGAPEPHTGGGRVEEIERRDDLRRIRVAAMGAETLVFLSMQYHVDWVARAAGERLRTVPVNGFYLGVVVPPGVRDVELRFEPMARWAWVPLAFFALCLVGLAGHSIARSPWGRQRIARPRPGPGGH